MSGMACDGEQGCTGPLHYVDSKGYAYCQEHGDRLKAAGRKGVRKLRQQDVAERSCHCFILHARTETERQRVGRALESARSLGDATGIMILLAQLGPCKSDPVEEPEAHRARVQKYGGPT